MAGRKTRIRGLGMWVDDLAQKLDLDLATVARKLTLDAWTKLSRRTPVDTGRARASWIVSVNEPGGGPPLLPGNYPPPAAPGVDGIDGSTAIFVTSNLIYMEALENGHSKQAPKGMVRITVAEIAAEIDVLLSSLED